MIVEQQLLGKVGESLVYFFFFNTHVCDFHDLNKLNGLLMRRQASSLFLLLLESDSSDQLEATCVPSLPTKIQQMSKAAFILPIRIAQNLNIAIENW